jgi:hypothetical protein
MFPNDVIPLASAQITRSDPEGASSLHILKPPVNVPIDYQIDAIDVAGANASLILVAGDFHVVVRQPDNEGSAIVRLRIEASWDIVPVGAASDHHRSAAHNSLPRLLRGDQAYSTCLDEESQGVMLTKLGIGTVMVAIDPDAFDTGQHIHQLPDHPCGIITGLVEDIPKQSREESVLAGIDEAPSELFEDDLWIVVLAEARLTTLQMRIADQEQALIVRHGNVLPAFPYA